MTDVVHLHTKMHLPYAGRCARDLFFDFSNPRLSPAPHCFLLNVKINHKTLKLIVFIYNMNMIDRMRKSPLR